MADNKDIEWAVEDIKERASNIALYRAYYDGDHRIPWATPKWRSQFLELFERFRDNLCPAVVDAKADRIQLTSIDGGSEPVNSAISRIWAREKLEARQGEITKNALKDGDAFIIVWPDDQNNARWFLQRGDRVAARYKAEPQGELEIAAKLWPEQEWTKDNKSKWRLNLYYPDRIERFITSGEVTNGEVDAKPEKWEPYTPEGPEDDDEGAPSQQPVTPNDYGIVPVFPFPNNADLGAYGRSELKDVIPIQDALNKSVANMLVAGEFVAWPQRYIIGIEVDVNEQGEPTGKEQRSALDRIMAIGNPNAKAGEFAGANLQPFLAEQDSFRGEMARISRTPLHYLLMSGQFPSGEALTEAERPLSSQIDDRIGALKPAWQASMSFALRVENVNHDPEAINPQFKDTKYRAASVQAEEWRVKKEMGVPDEQLWKEMGYDEAQIEQFKQAKLERAAAMQAAFDAGGGGAVVNPQATVGTGAENLVE